MDNTETIYILEDVIPYFEEIIGNQQEELEQLETQTAILQEQINGFSLIVNYQYATIGILVIAAIIALGWNVFNKWFFRGV